MVEQVKETPSDTGTKQQRVLKVDSPGLPDTKMDSSDPALQIFQALKASAQILLLRLWFTKGEWKLNCSAQRTDALHGKEKKTTSVSKI